MKGQEEELMEAAEQPRLGLLREVVAFLAENRKWWLLPIVLSLLLIGLLVALGGTAAAPFIYTIF